MSTVLPARPPQTLYMTIRRDEWQQLKAEREQLQQEVARLHALVQSLRGEVTDAVPQVR